MFDDVSSRQQRPNVKLKTCLMCGTGPKTAAFYSIQFEVRRKKQFFKLRPRIKFNCINKKNKYESLTQIQYILKSTLSVSHISDRSFAKKTDIIYHTIILEFANTSRILSIKRFPKFVSFFSLQEYSSVRVNQKVMYLQKFTNFLHDRVLFQ